ncbi:PREDICTED: uncharacterized protein LOC109211493 [Nicotiana attenuata]|uniref:uncharacterized protein LOC109211493 n=1 Tax=Nicotiana attenuata TaxID=49451 RepID=UPI0009050361|nr:PREDICTED: uncharacterized protein LOC109211493 [Nicotiana attenuata]
MAGARGRGRGRGRGRPRKIPIVASGSSVGARIQGEVTPKNTPEVYLHDEGYYVVRFNSVTDMHAVYYNGPYTISNRPIILKPWTTDFDFSKEFPSEIPLWVKFPNLPMNCWGSKSLSRIASVLGTPVFADECTTKQSRISYARMLVEINVSRPLPNEITVIDPKGKYFQQQVTYDWKPNFCGVYQVVGHKCREKDVDDGQKEVQHRRKRNKTVTQEWRYKGHVQPALPIEKQVEQIKENKQQIQQVNEKMNATPENRIEEQTGKNKGKAIESPEFNLQNFPIFCSVPIKNGFGVLHGGYSEEQDLPLDRGGGSKTI